MSKTTITKVQSASGGWFRVSARGEVYRPHLRVRAARDHRTQRLRRCSVRFRVVGIVTASVFLKPLVFPWAPTLRLRPWPLVAADLVPTGCGGLRVKMRGLNAVLDIRSGVTAASGPTIQAFAPQIERDR